MSLIPDDDVRLSNFVEACVAGEEGIDKRRDVLKILVEKFAL